MTCIDQHRIRLCEDDLIGEIQQGVGIHCRHGGGDDVEIDVRKGRLQSLLQHTGKGSAVAIRKACSRILTSGVANSSTTKRFTLSGLASRKPGAPATGMNSG